MHLNAITKIATWLYEQEFAEIVAIAPLPPTEFDVIHYCITTEAPLGYGPDINHTYTVAVNCDTLIIAIWSGTDITANVLDLFEYNDTIF